MTDLAENYVASAKELLKDQPPGWDGRQFIAAKNPTRGEKAIVYTLLAILEYIKPQPVKVDITLNTDEITAAVQEALA